MGSERLPDPVTGEYPPPHPEVSLYMISFYLVIITFLLNAIFGIILDSFAELRGADAAKKADMDNVCFICGLDRFVLDTKGGGFDRHIEHEHNMWHYLYLAVHLRLKPS